MSSRRADACAFVHARWPGWDAEWRRPVAVLRCQLPTAVSRRCAAQVARRLTSARYRFRFRFQFRFGFDSGFGFSFAAVVRGAPFRGMVVPRDVCRVTGTPTAPTRSQRGGRRLCASREADGLLSVTRDVLQQTQDGMGHLASTTMRYECKRGTTPPRGVRGHAERRGTQIFGVHLHRQRKLV